MTEISLDYVDSCIVMRDEISSALGELKAEIARINAARARGYATPYASVHAPGDLQARNDIAQLARKHRQRNPDCVMLIGIGGSSLGARAVYEALRGTLSHASSLKPRLVVAQTVDSDYTSDLLVMLDHLCDAGKTVLINVVSQSGSTTETIALASIVLDRLRSKMGDTYRQSVVITTCQGSPLHQFADQEGFDCLLVPQQVGGRYSVFTAVGLFPLVVCGIDIDAVCQGAQSMIERCAEFDTHNLAAVRAAVITIQRQRGRTIHDMFLFVPQLEAVGQWYRQLMGESLGKRYDVKGNQVWAGITPTVSIGTTDLHSVGQLYLGGPFDKMTTFVTVAEYKATLSVPRLFKSFAPVNLEERSLSSIMDAIIGGVHTAYRNEKRPFMSMSIPKITEHTIGQLMQMHMIEMIYCGFLMAVNPFDQPQVELYKDETRKLLAQE